MTKKVLILLTVLAAIACTSDNKNDTKSPNVVEQIKNDNAFFTEILLIADNALENGIFNKVILKQNEKPVFEIYKENGYDTIELKALEISNLVGSKNVLVHKIADTYYVSLFGAQYGCCARELTILQVDKSGIKQIFKENLEVQKIAGSAHGDIMYIGIDSYSEPLYPIDSLDVLLFTYNPRWVYRLKDGFKVDSSATRQYNEENYVFAGFEYDGEIKVAYPKDGEERKQHRKMSYVYIKSENATPSFSIQIAVQLAEDQLNNRVDRIEKDLHYISEKRVSQLCT